MLGKDNDPVERPPDDYQFHYPSAYVVQTWIQYRVHNLPPVSGGWNDQPYHLVVDDWGYLNWCYAYAMQELGEGRTPEGKPQDTLNTLIGSMGGGSENMMTWSQIREQS